MRTMDGSARLTRSAVESSLADLLTVVWGGALGACLAWEEDCPEESEGLAVLSALEQAAPTISVNPSNPAAIGRMGRGIGGLVLDWITSSLEHQLIAAGKRQRWLWQHQDNAKAGHR